MLFLLPINFKTFNGWSPASARPRWKVLELGDQVAIINNIENILKKDKKLGTLAEAVGLYSQKHITSTQF